jgi:hypothetical protein
VTGGRQAADRYRPVVDNVFHHERRVESLHARQGRKGFVFEAGVGVEVGGEDPQEVIGIAE